jgi:hypothetical protein
MMSMGGCLLVNNMLNLELFVDEQLIEKHN